jgi:S-layer homology domain
VNRRLRTVAILVVGSLLWSAAPVGAVKLSGTFTDDDTSVHEADIEAIAAAGITVGCNPPTSDRFCPESTVTRGQMAAFLHRALPDLPAQDTPPTFSDDDDSIFRADIEWLAATGVTKGCNPPSNSRFCPDDVVTRGQMAAFLTRALVLTDRGSRDFFDDDGSVFEADIERIAQAGITVGCNPPANDRFCPGDAVTRGQMSSFLVRALGLESLPPVVDLAAGWFCGKDGTSCSGTATSGPGRRLTVSEGWDQLLPFQGDEETDFRHADTRFELLIDGVQRSQPAARETSTAAVATRTWNWSVTTPTSGTFTIEGRWYWRDSLVRRTRVVVTIG